MPELKPCPFCGSEGSRAMYTPFGGKMGDRNDHFIMCTRCDAGGPQAGTEDAAVTKWNTRPSPETTHSATREEVTR